MNNQQMFADSLIRTKQRKGIIEELLISHKLTMNRTGVELVD